MTLSNLASIGNCVGGVAVLISLIFVAAQIRQNTRAVRAATSQEESSIYWQVNQILVTHADVAKLWSNGCADPKDLTDDEWVRYVALLTGMFRVCEGARLEWQRGQLDDKHWRSLEAEMIDVASQPGVRAYWAVRRHRQSAAFRSWFEPLLRKESNVELYPRAD
jgi:integrase